jgi:3-hydroxyacyl-CoA dehydrogenase
VRRYLAAMINEGANVVHEGIALRPLDVDVTFMPATASRATAAAR